MFGSKRPVVTPEEEAWFEASFQLLVELFGKEWLLSAPLVLPNKEFFPREYEPTEEWGGYAFERVCELMHIEPEQVTLEFMADHRSELQERGIWVQANTGGAAGLYFGNELETGQGPAVIAVNTPLLKQPERMVAVMSHELSHVLLLGGGKITRELEHMEPLTDLMTVFSGFGVFNANAAFAHETSSRGWSVWRTGYLLEKHFAYALALFAWLRGETKPVWSRELRKNVRVFMETTLAIFRANHKPVSWK